MKQTTKKILIGSSLLLAVLSPTIIATEKMQSQPQTQQLNQTSENIEKSIDATQLFELREVHLSSAETVKKFTFDEIKIGTRDYISGEYTRIINTLKDVEFELNFKISKEHGLQINDDNTDKGTFTDADGLSNQELNQNEIYYKLIPTSVLEKGNAEIYRYILQNDRTTSIGGDYHYGQNYDGETGMAIVISSYDYYDDFNLIKPIVIHITWDSEFNNGSKTSKKSIYYDDLENDSVDLYYKSKKADLSKSWGSISKTSSFRRFEFKGTFQGEDISTGLNTTYFFNKEREWYSELILNSISNAANFSSVDFSENAIRQNINKTKGEWSNYYYYDPYFPTFYTAFNLEEAMGETKYTELINKLENDVTVNVDEYLDEILQVREDEYNNIYFKNNSDFNIENGYGGYTILNNDELYLIEKIEIEFFDNNQTASIEEDDYSAVSNMFQGSYEYGEFIVNNNILGQFAETGSVVIYGTEYHNYVSPTGSDEYYDEIIVSEFEIDDKAGFMSAPQIVLIFLAILTIIGLAIVIFFLFRSNTKETESIEVVLNEKVAKEKKVKKTKGDDK